MKRELDMSRAEFIALMKLRLGLDNPDAGVREDACATEPGARSPKPPKLPL